jgi:hypothetical protein
VPGIFLQEHGSADARTYVGMKIVENPAGARLQVSLRLPAARRRFKEIT